MGALAHAVRIVELPAAACTATRRVTPPGVPHSARAAVRTVSASAHVHHAAPMTTVHEARILSSRAAGPHAASSEPHRRPARLQPAWRSAMCTTAGLLHVKTVRSSGGTWPCVCLARCWGHSLRLRRPSSVGSWLRSPAMHGVPVNGLCEPRPRSHEITRGGCRGGGCGFPLPGAGQWMGGLARPRAHHAACTLEHIVQAAQLGCLVQAFVMQIQPQA